MMTKRCKFWGAVAFIAALLPALSASAEAVCDGSKAESDENIEAAAGPWPGTFREFFPWHLNSYYIYPGKFRGADFWDGDLSKEYGKHLTSAYLIERGVQSQILLSYFEHGTLTTKQASFGTAFHTSEGDWGPNSRAKSPVYEVALPFLFPLRWHRTFYSLMDEEFEPGDTTTYGFWYKPGKGPWETIKDTFFDSGIDEMVITYCPAYNVPNEAVVRAMTLVHEAQHSHLDYVGAGPYEHRGPDHADEPIENRNCQFPDGACELYNFKPLPYHKHGISGSLWESKIGPYQLEHMFACDLTDAAQDWVPLETQLIAEAASFDLGKDSHHWVNIAEVPFHCGHPTPLRDLVPGEPCPADAPGLYGGSGLRCTDVSDCLSTDAMCLAGCCAKKTNIK